MSSRVIISLLLLVALAVYTNGYSTQGNKILDKNGQPILIRGIDRPSFEWSATGESISLADYTNIKSWGANCVRLALNQCFWFTNSNYQATILQSVNWIKSLGMGVILDLHWSEGSDGTCAQKNMADTRSVVFWQQVATAYKNDPMIIFELYNEPHDVSWSVWQSGGDAGGFQSPGMQGLLNAVRGTGANNLVLIGGLNWAYDLSGVPSHPITGSNIAYASHPYDFGGKQAGDWDSGFGFLAATYPIVLTEFGSTSASCNSAYSSTLIAYADQKDISYTAWAWYPGGCAFPAIINDWTGSPSASGAIVKQSLLNGPKAPKGSSSSSSSSSGSSSHTTTTTTTVKPQNPPTNNNGNNNNNNNANNNPPSTTKPQQNTNGGNTISVSMNAGCNIYWIAIDRFTGATKTTTTVQFKDSAPGAQWAAAVTQNWGTGNSRGWSWGPGRAIKAPVSLLLTSDNGATVTLTDVIQNLNPSSSFTSNGQY